MECKRRPQETYVMMGDWLDQGHGCVEATKYYGTYVGAVYFVVMTITGLVRRWSGLLRMG